MKFKDYATNEASLLVSRVMAKRSRKAAEEFRAFHQALGEAAKAFESVIGAWGKGEPDDEMLDFVDRVTAAAATQVQAAAQHTKAEAQAAIEAAHKESDLARKEADAARKELDERVKEKNALADSLKEMRARVEGLEAECRAEKEQVKVARAEGTKAREAHAVSAAACRDAEAARDQEARAKAVAEGEAKKLRSALEAADGKLKGAERAAEELRQTLAKQLKASAAQIEALDRTNKEHERARQDLQVKLNAAAEAELKLRERVTEAEKHATEVDKRVAEADAQVAEADTRMAQAEKRATEAEHGMKRARAEAQTTAQAVTHAAGALESARAQVSLSLSRLLKVAESLLSVTSTADGLTMLTKGLANDFSRVALFNVKGNHLEGVDQIGFDSKSHISKVVIPMTMDSVMTRAVNSGRVESAAAEDAQDGTRAVFGGTPASLLALPIAVHDDTVAVIYADDSGQSETGSTTLEQRTTFAELLRLHALPVFEKFSIDPKTLEERRAYAKLLVDEVEYMYSADVNDGKKEPDVKSRLKDNLQTARQMYAQRYVSEGPAAAPVLEEYLASVTELKKGTPFARDLAGVIKRPGKAHDAASRAS